MLEKTVQTEIFERTLKNHYLGILYIDFENTGKCILLHQDERLLSGENIFPESEEPSFEEYIRNTILRYAVGDIEDIDRVKQQLTIDSILQGTADRIMHHVMINFLLNGEMRFMQFDFTRESADSKNVFLFIEDYTDPQQQAFITTLRAIKNSAVLYCVLSEEADARTTLCYDPVFITRGFAEVMETTQQEMMQLQRKPFSETVHPDDQQYVVDAVRSLNVEHPHTNIFYRKRNPQGKWFYIQSDFSFLIVGKKKYIYVTYQNFSELHKNEEALRLALASAEHANKAKTTFLNNMSHDIRTPMNAIIGFTALAASHIDQTDLVKEYLTKIGTSGQHLLSLINDVLDMSRIESGIVTIEENEVCIPDILHDLTTIIQGNIHAKQLDLYIDTQDVVHEHVITDRLRLNQVLLNIVSNAIKFTPAGGVINIRVAEKPCSRKGCTTFEFRIRDNGLGMSDEFQSHVFDAFTRERTSTQSGITGTGLGMAITRNIVEMMGGSITLTSKEGKGSEFVVTLHFKTLEKATVYGPIPELAGARALVVDDDVHTCTSVSKMLRDIEMRADWSTSGKEAVIRAKEAFEQNDAFKAYIIDWLMPDMNGIETVRRIRAVIGDDTPIIILTAYDWADIEQEAKEAGVTAFVEKPIFMSELRKVLTRPMGIKEEPAQQLNRENRHAGKKILLVEDNELNREIATALLEEIGISVDSVEDGADAVERMNEVEEDRYDLIFMDIQMPKMDGYMATREIRTLKNNWKANIPIVAMTANAFEEDKKKAFKAGMNAHIAKPIDITAILSVLDQVFG